jgi:hypothetical protein
MCDGGWVNREQDRSIEQQAKRRERTMDTDIRLQQVAAHQQQLRDEAATYHLARGGQIALRPSQPADRIPRTIGALRRLVGSMA